MKDRFTVKSLIRLERIVFKCAFKQLIPVSAVNCVFRRQNKGNQFEEYNIGNHSAMRIDIANGNINLKIVSSLGTVLLNKVVKDAKAGKKTVYITTKMED